MNSGKEKRRHPRHPVTFVMFPVLVKAPALSAALMDPEDISLGGFRVVVPEEPLVGQIIECDVELKGRLYEDCRARVAWTRPNDTIPPSWSCGLSLNVPLEARGQFHATLGQVIADLGMAPGG